MTSLGATANPSGALDRNDHRTKSTEEVSMTTTTTRLGRTLTIALFVLAALAQSCASGGAIPAQPQNPSVNAAATRG
jgi:hypothetical protein